MNLRSSFLLTLVLSTAFSACGGASDEDVPAVSSPEDEELAKAIQPIHIGCRTHGDCDDTLFCNGTERCTIANVFGNTVGTCRDGADPSCNDGIGCTADSCSESVHACVNRLPDADGDGHADGDCVDQNGNSGDDCNDHNGQRYPGAVEICNGVDEDCNPATLHHPGQDGDADGDGHVSSACCNGSACGGDCDDSNPDTHPVNVDPCDDRDNDCDGQVDENCQDVECAGEVALYPDTDRDGFGAVGSSPVNACNGAQNLSPLANDCDDTNPAIKPGSNSCSGASSVRTCGSNGQYQTALCPGTLLPRCFPQPNGTGVCTAAL